MSRNFYILAATLGFFALLSGGMSLVPSTFQPGLPANASMWRTIALFLALAALAFAFIGVMTNLFEQVDRRSEQARLAARRKRRGEKNVKSKLGMLPRKASDSSMYEVTVEAEFSSGHYLRNYKGKCENPHGHNYKVRVTLVGKALDEAGLLLDFKLLKQVLRPVIERIDHQMLNDLEPFTTLNPSAENIARYFFEQTNEQLAEMTDGRVRVKDCTIWETDTTSATYYE